MAINYSNNNGCQQPSCPDKFGCTGQTPDFTIRQHDTRPEFKVAVDDCDGPMDIRGLVIEVNMWALAKLKTDITQDADYFRLADDIGFEQIMINDIIVMDRVRLPEYMLVTGFDEDDKLVRVQRGYKGTVPSRWKKGSKMRIFRIMNGQGETELVYEDIREIDGTVKKDTITSASLVYKWQPEDTCLPGCYYLEFKMLKMIDLVLYLPGGHWIGPVYRNDDDAYYTGTTKTESSVKLSYDSVNDRYLLPTDHWTGDFHVYSANYYTGIEHNDGSVYLDRNDKPFNADNEQMPVGIPASTYTVPSRVDAPPICEPPVFLARPYDDRVPFDERVPYENPFTEPFYYPGSIGEPTVMMFSLPSVTPSFTPPSEYNPPSSFDPTTYGCWLGIDVEWARRLPVDGEGFLIEITSSPTVEF